MPKTLVGFLSYMLVMAIFCFDGGYTASDGLNTERITELSEKSSKVDTFGPKSFLYPFENPFVSKYRISSLACVCMIKYYFLVV